MPRRNQHTTPTALHAASVSAPTTFNDGLPLPKIMVFDLDYTLWPFWVDTHVTGPIKADPSAPGLRVKDKYGETYSFYRDIAGILQSCREKGVKVGAASRTYAPDLGREMLKLLRVPAASGSEKAIEYFNYLQIFPGDKKTHFRKIQEASGIEYEEMLFFDDESRNKNVEQLGVVMQLVRDGVSRDEVDRGVESWRKRNRRF